MRWVDHNFRRHLQSVCLCWFVSMLVCGGVRVCENDCARDCVTVSYRNRTVLLLLFVVRREQIKIERKAYNQPIKQYQSIII